MPVEDIKSKAQFDELINSGKTIFIDFHATWCGPCKVISPIFQGFANDPRGDNVGFYKVDIDDQAEIAQEVNITAMPTFKVFKDGESIGSLIGANPPQLTILVNTHAPKTE
ncbi:thioredoxin [Paxillus ammoniavirescens]|nr:thioredoxin [Paxillus ammoniavirescens]